MSNLQDVPLAELENVPKTEQDTHSSKSNSLKRFFKLGKKSNSSQDFNEEVTDLEEDTNKDATKPSSMSRFLTRLKGSSKTGNVHFDESGESTVSPTDTPPKKETEKPVPNAKPTLKTSISGYWKQLFHRQKAANRQAQKPTSDGEPSESEQQEQQEQQADPIKAEDEAIETSDKSHEDTTIIVPEKSIETQANRIPDIIEEVQVLAVSEETVDPSHEDSKKED